MFDRLDEINWAVLNHAYGNADDVPRLLRAAAGPDEHEAGAAVGELYSSLFHQGSVYPATAAAVPFLIRLAVAAPWHRAGLVLLVGGLADPYQAHGPTAGSVRGAVVAGGAALVPLLADADPGVRAAAAYAVAQTDGPAEVLLDRWRVEDDERARASLALAIGLRDPAGSATSLRAAVLDPPLSVLAAAAVALVRNGIGWPAGAIGRVAEVLEDAVELDHPWQRQYAEVSEELAVCADDGLADELLGTLVRAESSAQREIGAWMIGRRCAVYRSAPARLVPLLGPLLHDPAQPVRLAAVAALRDAGAAADSYADDLAHIAAGFPAVAGAAASTPEAVAIVALMRAGDPRWLTPVGAAWAAGHKAFPPHNGIPFDPRVLAAARQRLRALVAAGAPGGELDGLVTLIGWWRGQAREADEDLRAARSLAADSVRDALDRIGAATPEPSVEQLRHWAKGGHVRSAVEVWQRTGDATELVSILQPRVAEPDSDLDAALRQAADAGPALGLLVPGLQRYVHGKAARNRFSRDLQVAAARIIWRATGDAARVLPTVTALLAAGRQPAVAAVDLAQELIAGAPELAAAVADPAAHTDSPVTDLIAALRGLVDPAADALVPAARLLAGIGTPIADLVPALVAVIEADELYCAEALELIVDLHATDALPALTTLAERDRRIATHGSNGVVRHDEQLQQDLRAAVARLASVPRRDRPPAR
ncbi:hypothetical protein [Dactylosporangium salmoneum]|uniref:HEAT repeat protein n=1 Tax=Dactylosporangium salmoneum TaxID=53361 RepID=A0ABP5UKJ6_9ACTN